MTATELKRGPQLHDSEIINYLNKSHLILDPPPVLGL